MKTVSTYVLCCCQVLKGAKKVEGRPGASMKSLDFAQLKVELEEKHGIKISDRDAVSSAMYPKVFDDFVDFEKSYGPVSKLDTRTYFVGPDIAQELTVCSLFLAVSGDCI